MCLAFCYPHTNVAQSTTVVCCEWEHPCMSDCDMNEFVTCVWELCTVVLCSINVLIMHRDVKDKIVIYDGSYEQELYYHGDQLGILLLMDMWHPGLPADKLPSL